MLVGRPGRHALASWLRHIDLGLARGGEDAAHRHMSLLVSVGAGGGEPRRRHAVTVQEVALVEDHLLVADRALPLRLGLLHYLR